MTAAVPMHYATLSQACQRIKSGEWTSLQVTQHLLQRIEVEDAQLHSYARLRSEQALQRAALLDQRRQAGEPLGLLHGVPIAVKDLLFIQGEIAASGTVVMQDYRPGYSATVVERLEQAGAVIIGQTQLTEGAFGLHHPDITAPLNPWHPDYWPGVSSSGSGVAVAAGLAYGALGSDTGGSIRFPSACCGLVGLKPTYGRVSRYGAWPLAPSLDHIGPMTRSVADAARMLQAIAGADQNDDSTLLEPVPNYAAIARKPLQGLTIGVDWSYAGAGVAPSVLTLVQQTCALLQELGATLSEVVVPAQARTLTQCWSETCGFETAQAHASFYPAQAHRYGPALLSLIEIGRRTTAQRYALLEQERQAFRAELTEVFKTIDLLVTPTIPGPVPTVASAEGGAISDAVEQGSADYLTFTAPFDYSGNPTLSLPAGTESQSSGGRAQLPRSVQLVAPMLGEAQLIRVGLALEAALNAHYGSLFGADSQPR